MTDHSPSLTPIQGFFTYFIPMLTAVSLVLTPLVVAYIAAQASSSSTTKDYVSIAVTILNSKDSAKSSRKWAIQVLQKLSPVDVPEEMRQELGQGGALGGSISLKTVEVKVPVGVPCISAKTLRDIRERRPLKLTVSSLPRGSGFTYALIRRAVKLDDYADYAGALIENCATLNSPVSDKPSASGK